MPNGGGRGANTISILAQLDPLFLFQSNQTLKRRGESPTAQSTEAQPIKIVIALARGTPKRIPEILYT